MDTWKIAAVQMDCVLGEKARNLETIRKKLGAAKQKGARLVVFPECALSGYSFESRDEAWPHSEPFPGPAGEVLAADCRRMETWAVYGFLERDQDKLFNSCALIGPAGPIAVYRKIHLPCMGADRFTTPGDRPFAVHDLGGLRIGINICYDGGFPESARVLTLLGADLVVLPTNWPTGAWSTARYLVRPRALENHIYYAAVNRVGEERGFRFIGQSQIANIDGELLAAAGEEEEILLAAIEPALARQKRDIKIPGKHEIDRVHDRRPEMYQLLAKSPPLFTS